jgi:hypothetical protein
MSSRKTRRAAEHAARKAARKAGFPTVTTEPCRPLPTFESITRAPLVAAVGEPIAVPAVRHNGVFKLLNTEDPNGFEALKQDLVEEHEPKTATERILVHAMAESHWLSQRALRLQDACLDPASGQITDPKLFSLYLRCQTTHTRAFHKCVSDLTKLRAERRKDEQHEMKKQKHYWEVVRKDAQACRQISQNTHEYLKSLRDEPGFKAQYEADLASHGLKQAELTLAEIAA